MRFRDFYEDLKVHSRPDAPQSPTVSVILPTFARAHGSLQRAIDSVLMQSFGDFELIVVDDGSRDGTADVLADYQRDDPRLIIYRFDKNSGLPALRVNQGILASKGRYIAYQFDDDVWTVDSLEARVDELKRHGEPSVVYGLSRAEVLLPDGSVTERAFGADFNFGLLYNGNYIANNSAIHDISLFDVAGLLDPHIIARRYSDYDLWLRFGRWCHFYWLNHHVSTVSVNANGSLGRTIDLCINRHRRYIEIDRNHLLMKGSIFDYDVVGIDHLHAHFDAQDIDSARREEIIPFIARNNDYFSDQELVPSIRSRRKKRNMLVIKPDYSTSVDVTIRNYTTLRDFPVRHSFLAERSVSSANLNGVDTVVLYRTVSERTTRLLRDHAGEKTFVYLMDDNMLRFGEVGKENAFLAVGTAAHVEIQNQISEAHACVGYSDQIVADMAALNPHTIRLDTNIPLRYVMPRYYNRSDRLRLAILSGPVRHDIIAKLWTAVRTFVGEALNAVEIEVWGVDPSAFEPLPCPLRWRPFTHSYDLYRKDLMEASFDVVLSPLDVSTLAARSKSPVKFLEAVTCGAICIFTDAPPYAALPDDVCLKTENTVEAWHAALRKARDLGPKGRMDMLERARQLVVERYVTERQIDDFLLAFDAADLHRCLRDRPIVYVFHEMPLGGATLHLLRHVGLARSCGFKVIGIAPDSETYREAFLERWRTESGNSPLLFGTWTSGYHLDENGSSVQRAIGPEDEQSAATLEHQLRTFNVGLLHAATWNPTAVCLARILNVPCVFSVHQFYPTAFGVLKHFADAIHCSSLNYARIWEREAETPVRRIVCPVEDIFFDAYEGNRKRTSSILRKRRILISGTLQKRKNQIDAIRAVGLLSNKGYDVELDLIGYMEFYTTYSELCQREAEQLGISGRVHFHDFVDQPEKFYNGYSDILLVAATDESMPQTMLQAMAAGVLVVATYVGGVSELIKHRYSGVIVNGHTAEDIADALRYALDLTPEQRVEIIARAHRTISLLGKSSYVRAELIDLYNQAYESNAERRAASIQRDAAWLLDKPLSVVGVTSTTSVESVLTEPYSTTSVPTGIAAAATLSTVEVSIPQGDDLIPDEPAHRRLSFDVEAEVDHTAGVALVLAADGGGERRICLTVAAVVRPDIILRQGEVDLPADGVPRRVAYRFTPLSPTKGRKLRVEITVDRGSARTYAIRGAQLPSLVELLS